jgi:O-antigen ligase
MIKAIINRKEKVVFSIAFICGIFLLIPFKIKPIVAFSMLLFLFFKSKKINFKEVLVLNLLFFSYCFSLFYCFDTKTGLDYLVRVLPLFSIPLCYTFLENKIQLKFNTIFYKTFILSSVVYVFLIFLYMSQIGYFAGDKDLYVSYSFLTYQFWGFYEHPIYISLALGLSIILLTEHNFKYKFVNIVFFLILTIGILFLARKAVIISLFFSLIFISVFKKSNKQIKFIVITFGLLFLISLLFREIRVRYLELFFLNNIVENSHTSTGIRNIVWSNSIELIKQFPIFGYSVGDVQNVLSNQLTSGGFVELAKRNINAHNQYLQTILTSGFVGLGCFIVSIFYAFRKLINNKKYLEICLLLFFSLNFFTESFLYRQNGILLYSLFISIGVISLPIMEKSKKKVLIIGSFPGPTKGISLSNLIVYNGLKGKGWQVDKINTERTNKVDVELGKFSLSKLKFVLSYFECYKINLHLNFLNFNLTLII